MTRLDERHLLRVVASKFFCQVIETAEMLDMQPAFNVLPLARAQQRECVILIDPRAGDDPPIAVIADPFDADLQVWLETVAGRALVYRLALPSDIQAYLSRQEESIRAIDSMIMMAHWIMLMARPWKV